MRGHMNVKRTFLFVSMKFNTMHGHMNVKRTFLFVSMKFTNWNLYRSLPKYCT
jgi:hypothetical protein